MTIEACKTAELVPEERDLAFGNPALKDKVGRWPSH